METLVFVFIIAAIGFMFGRASKSSPSPSDAAFSDTPIHSLRKHPEHDNQKIPLNGKRFGMLIFLSGWIIAWSAGILFAFSAFFHSFGENFVTIFLGGWLLAAIAGWFAVVRTIYKLITGQAVYSRGERF